MSELPQAFEYVWTWDISLTRVLVEYFIEQLNLSFPISYKYASLSACFLSDWKFVTGEIIGLEAHMAMVTAHS